MLDTGYSPWPSFTREEVDAVSRVMQSNRVNQWTGSEVRNFETEFAAWCGVPHAVALTNGTVALELCWKSLGIGPGDEVVTTPRTFVASAFSILEAGATPIFADVDLDSQNITPETVARVLTPKTKAVLMVHLGGWPCDLDGFLKLAKDHNLLLVEDCAQAHGAKWRGAPVGSQSAMAAWSFCQDKIISTGGEGGMVTTKDESLWQTAWSFKDHGKSWEAMFKKEHPPGPRLVHDSVGTNWRMLEMQASIGRIQLRHMDEWQRKRLRNATQILDTAAKFQALRIPVVPNQATHAFYRAYAFVKPEALASNWTRDRIIAEVNANGMPCFHGSASEIYLEKAFELARCRPEHRLPNARQLGETSIAFLVHPTLSEGEIHRMQYVIEKVLRAAQR